MLVRVAGAGLACMFALLAVINPVLGLSAAMMLLLAAGFTQSATFGVCAFVFFTYFELITEYTGNTAMSPIKVTGGALIALALLQLVTSSRHRASQRARTLDQPAWSRHPVILGAMVGFVALGMMSASWAVNEAQVRTIVERLLTEALMFVAIGVFLMRTRQYVALASTVLVAGVLSTLAGMAIGNEEFGRLVGTFTDPNEYAAAMVVSIALGYGALGVARSSLGRGACMAGMAICAYGIMASQSRGGLIALVVSAVVIVLSSRGRERVRLLGASSLAVAAAIAMLVVTPMGQQLLDRVNHDGSSGRDDLWEIAYSQFKDEPVHGVGLGNYPAVAARYISATIQHSELVNNNAPRTVHNAYLEIAAELGIAGLVTFGTFVFGSLLLCVRGLRRARRLGEPDTVRMGRAVLAATIGLLASCMFLSGQYNELLWAMLAACVGFHALVVRRERVLAALETAHDVAENLPVDDLQLDLDGELATVAIEEFAAGRHG